MPQTNLQIEALVRRNAQACETAKRFQCKCRCGGSLHRKAHTEEWLQEQIAEAIEEGGNEN